MKTSSIIKAVVAVTTIVTVGKMVYDKVKKHNENTIDTVESNDVKANETDNIKTEETPAIMNKVIDKYNELSEQKKAIILVGGAVVTISGLMLSGHLIGAKHGEYAFIKSVKELTNGQKYTNACDKAWNKYTSSSKFQNDTERLLNSLIPRSYDEYITRFMKKDLANDSEAYQYYLDNKLNTDLWYTCIFCKVLDSGLISMDQFKDACNSTRIDILQLSEQEV